MGFSLSDTAPGQFASGKKKMVFNAGYEATKEYTEPNSVITPEIQLLFSPFGLPFIPIEVIGTDINKIINSFVWTKDRNNPGGILQVVLTPDTRIIENIVKILNTVSGNLYSSIWGVLGVDLEDLFKPMTLCQLWIDGCHVMTGTVRACSRSSSVDSTSKSVSYSLIIEELGNLYNMATTSLDLILEDGFQTQIADATKTALATSSNLKGISVATGINAIIQAFISTTLTEGMTLSDGFPLAYRLLALTNPLGGLANQSLASFMTMDVSMYELNSSGSPQSVWSFMQSFIPSPWMEFFTESGGRTIVTDGLGAPAVLFPGFNYPVARSTPYSNILLGTVNPAHIAQTALFDLNAVSMLVGGDFVIITDDMMQQKTLGFDSINQSTVFRTTYGNRAGTSAPDLQDRNIKSYGPLNPKASGGIGTFGLREMTQSIDSTSLIGLGNTFSYVERIAKNIFGITGQTLSKALFNNLLAVWFRNQSRFREGTVTVKGMPYARAGMYCLYMPSTSGKKADNLRDIGIYYIDSLTHNYSVENTGMSFTTTLNLIRGVPLPTTLAQTALLLFDFELLPPASGLADGEAAAEKTTREAVSQV